MLHLTRQITQRGTQLRILRGEVHVLKYKLEPLCRQNPSMSSPRLSRSRRWIWRGVRARAPHEPMTRPSRTGAHLPSPLLPMSHLSVICRETTLDCVSDSIVLPASLYSLT